MPVQPTQVPPIGTRVTVHATAFDGEPYQWAGTVKRAPEPHGYCRNGEWSRYNGTFLDWERSYRVGIVPKGHRKIRAYRLDLMDSIVRGWNGHER